MKSIIISLISILIFTAIGGCADTTSSISDMFQAMRSGTYEKQYDRYAFPKVTWNDIPELLTYVESTIILKSHPINMASSMSPPNCTEGIMAIWLIEGIRKGVGKVRLYYPSQIPVCYDTTIPVPPSAGDFALAKLKTVAMAYTKWWKKVKNMNMVEGSQVDPLDGTSLSWYGSRFGRRYWDH